MSSPFDNPRAAYIHVPFCVHRCGYCDFTLVARRGDLMNRYLSALAIELRSIPAGAELDTLFIGGGTPTHLPPEKLTQLCDLLQERFVLTSDAEFSVEANPAGLTTEKIDILANAGGNRISLGVQSFDASALETLERDHQEADIHAAVEAVRSRIDNVSLDLIFAVPGQSLESWRHTLEASVALSPRHVSTYGLTFEKGTAFWSRREKGTLQQASESMERSLYETAIDTLTDAGYEQYEISNFAQPGFACRHNQVYWRGEPYYACGPGAARYIHGVRETNHRSVTTWLKRIEAGQSPVGDREELSVEERAREKAVLGLRQTAGLDLEQFQEQTGFCLEKLANDAITRHTRDGLLEEVDSHLRLTREGRCLADFVIVDFLA